MQKGCCTSSEIRGVTSTCRVHSALLIYGHDGSEVVWRVVQVKIRYYGEWGGV